MDLDRTFSRLEELNEYYSETVKSLQEEIESELENENLTFATIGSSQPFLTDASDETLKSLVKHVSLEEENLDDQINDFIITEAEKSIIWSEMLDEWFGENAFKPYLTEKFIRG